MLDFKKYLTSLVSLFFPQYCCGCSVLLYSNENHICTKCLYNLPKTHFHQNPENIIAQKFWGKVAIENATAFYFFQKSLRIQKIMHHFKYKNDVEVGLLLGKLAGDELRNSPFNEIDCIVSVPLHEKRKRLRGYNQSDIIAEGLAEGLGKVFKKEMLKRIVNTTTQTRKNRFERWENTQNIFEVSQNTDLTGQHVLLVDDVITTGATLESCAMTLKEKFDCKVSIFALTVAS